MLEVQSSDVTSDISSPRARHEEADTRLILHAIQSQSNMVVVSARNTDVLLLLVSHFPRVQCTTLWMMSGTSEKQKYVPIEAVYNNLPTNSATALLPFHAHQVVSMENVQGK